MEELRLGRRFVSAPPKVMDLFAGAGGLSLGFKNAGFQIVAGSDHDPDAMATFARNFIDAESIVGDIRDPQINERIMEHAQGVDVVVGGPPCQAFSQVRNHSRIIDDPRNTLYKEFVRIVEKTQPRAFVMENVPGMAQMGVKQQVIADLSLRGAYRVTAQLLDAADFGVPQTRKRLVFIGLRSDLHRDPPVIRGTGASALVGLDRLALDSGYEPVIRGPRASAAILTRLLEPGDADLVTAQQAISDLTFLRAGDRRSSAPIADLAAPTSSYQRLMRTADTVENLEVPRINRDTALRLQAIPAGGNQRDIPDDLRTRYITGQRWGQDAGTDRLARKHYSAYRRLHPNLWAWTLNTKADSVYHYAEARALSVREFCRLQSFPDHFVIATDPRPGKILGRMPNGPGHSRYRQVGNAVPPRLAAAIAREVSLAISAAGVESESDGSEVLSA